MKNKRLEVIENLFDSIDGIKDNVCAHIKELCREQPNDSNSIALTESIHIPSFVASVDKIVTKDKMCFVENIMGTQKDIHLLTVYELEQLVSKLKI